MASKRNVPAQPLAPLAQSVFFWGEGYQVKSERIGEDPTILSGSNKINLLIPKIFTD